MLRFDASRPIRATLTTLSCTLPREAVAAEMYLVFGEGDEAAPELLDPQAGRSVPQSAFWRIGAFMSTTDSDRLLAELSEAQ